MNNIENVDSVINGIDQWLDKNGWAGWDPYFIRELPIIMRTHKLTSTYLGKIIHYGLLFGATQYAGIILPLFRSEKRIIPKGMGLCGSAYLNLFEKTQDSQYLDKAINILEWLENNSNKDYNHFCWGYPFDWQSSYFIPRGTPSIVVTKFIGDAFLKAYAITGEDKYMDIVNSICNFITHDIKTQSGNKSDEICFSYTPIAQSFVHNASLMGAEFLAKVGSLTNNDDWLGIAKAATTYSMRQQNSDGSIPYFGIEESRIRMVKTRAMQKFDNYHTGYVLRSFIELNNIFNSKMMEHHVQMGAKYYIDSFVDVDGCPKMYHDAKYPIDAHSAAESILSNYKIMCHIPKYQINSSIILDSVIGWTIKNMWLHKRQYFLYRITKFGKIKVPYIRWSQAMMFNALTEVKAGV
jgi:hypothetical protein